MEIITTTEKPTITQKEEKFGKSLYECDKVIFVRLRKDLGFLETGNYGFCSINKNSAEALQPCCEDVCPLGLKIDKVIKTFDKGKVPLL